MVVEDANLNIGKGMSSVWRDPLKEYIEIKRKRRSSYLLFYRCTAAQ
jgi:hypothetical protein